MCSYYFGEKPKTEAEPASAASAEEPVDVNVSADDQTADEDTIRSALHAALEDEDASVRRDGLQAALATHRGPEAMEYVAQALRDEDPGVRTMAAESVRAEGQGIALLEQALSDPDEAVRAVAAARLNPEPEHR